MELNDDNDIFRALQATATEFNTLGNLYACATFHSDRSRDLSDIPPAKIDGMVIMLIMSGHLTFEFNLINCEITAGNFIVIPHGSVFKPLECSADLDIRQIYFTTDFLHNVNINFSAISIPTFIDRHTPAQTLSPDECELLLRYMDLLTINAHARVNEQIESNIAASLMAAMVYQLVQFHYKSIGTGSSSRGERSCRNAYVHDFMKLVHVHYTRERSVNFYAGKLCISPKYLSLLVKQTTGRSAARWIDEFVLMEAKNMLRFSGKNVQQVAYALNFSNQSSFGKFFKHMTGQSPTEYQKS